MAMYQEDVQAGSVPRARDLACSISAGDVVDLAAQLVRIPSITAEEGPEISRFMADWLSKSGLEPVLQEAGEGRWNVVCRLRGRYPGKRLLFGGHLDTKWINGMTIDPFRGEVQGGRLYGRGACDMKSALAAMMVALRAMREHELPAAGEVVMAVECGEECGRGTSPILDRDGYLDADLAVIGEPSELRIDLGNRGICGAEVETLGVATHAGTAQKGVNAIRKAARFIEELYALPLFEICDPVWGKTALNVTRIEGGGRWEASVADACKIWVEIRNTPKTPADEIGRAITGLLRDLAAGDPDFRWRDETFRYGGGDAIAISRDEWIVKVAERSVEEVLGRKAALGGCPGATMVGYFIGKGIPGIILGPGSLEQAHSADEWVDIEQVVAAARIYALIGLWALGEPGGRLEIPRTA